MADFLIYAQPSGADGASQYQAGDVVEVRETGAGRGGLEALPRFVWVSCPEVTKAQVEDRMEEWHHVLDFEVVARDVALDGWRLRVFNTTAASGGYGALARERVESFLTNWGAVVQSVNPGEVIFDWRVLWGASSPQFWGASVQGLTFTELAYDQATGAHRIEVNHQGVYSAAVVAARVASRGGTVVSQPTGRTRFDIGRDVVRSAFQQDVIWTARGLIRRRRFHVSDADLATIVAAGGEVTVTAAQLASRILDKRGE